MPGAGHSRHGDRAGLLSSDSIQGAAAEIEDYAESAGAMRQGIAEMNGKQKGDPRKLALALIQLVNHADPPFRFAAGDDAIEVVAKKVGSMRAELDKWRARSGSLAHDS